MDRDCPESAETLTPRTVLGWSAAGLGFLVLAYFAGTVVIPAVRAHRAAFDAASTITEGCFWKNVGAEAVEKLGGPERAARYLSISMRFSREPAAEAMLLGACGRHGVGPLVRALDSDNSLTSEWAGAASGPM